MAPGSIETLPVDVRDGILDRIFRRLARQQPFIIAVAVTVILGTLTYLNNAPQDIPVRAVIGLCDNWAGGSQRSHRPAADLLHDAAAIIASPQNLSQAIALLEPSRMALFAAGGDPVKTLHGEMKVSSDPAERQLKIELTSPYPHEALQAVNAVTQSFLAGPLPAPDSADASAKLASAALRVVTPATVDPGLPRPSLLTALLAAAAVGLALGIVLAALPALLDRRLRSPRHIFSATGLKTLGCLPSLPRRLSPAARSLASHMDPHSDAAAACRWSLLNLLGGPARDHVGVLLVTSPSGGEGRTTIIANLAAALAASGEPVLVIDADLRSPVLYKVFGQSDAMGFCEAIDNPGSAREFVRSTHVTGLSLLSCGKPSATSAARMHGQAMQELLLQFRPLYSYILLDAGPVLGDSQAAAVAPACDAAILVLHADRSRLGDAAEACEILTRQGARIAGAIVNDLPNDDRRRFFHVADEQRGVREGYAQYDEIHDFGLAESSEEQEHFA